MVFKHRRKALIGVLCFLMAFCFPARVFSAENDSGSATTDGRFNHFVTIFDNDGSGNRPITFRTNASRVADILDDAGYRIAETDVVEPALDTFAVSSEFVINIHRGRIISVRDGRQISRIISPNGSRQDIVARDIGVYDEDKITPRFSGNFLATGSFVEYQVTKSKLVHFNFYGEVLTFRTQAETVGEFLKERNIELDEDDWISLSLGAAITDGMELSLSRQGVSTVTVTEATPYTERIERSFERLQGEREVRTEGQAGERIVTYEIETMDGVEISRTVISEIIVREPVQRVVIVGMRVDLPPGSHQDWMRAAGIAESDFGYANFIISAESRWRVTVYNYAGSGAYGLCQALPGSRMATHGADWATNPITQLRWCNDYALGRYGSWRAAYEFWRVRKWW